MDDRDNNRWRDRDQGSRFEERGQGRDRDYGRSYQGGGQNYSGGQHQGGSHDDRGFMARAGDEVRSWFGDDDAEQRRERDERRWERERGMTGQRSNQDENNAYAGPGATASGWGNQAGESWNRDRPGTSGSYGAYGASDYGGQDGRERSGSSWGNESSRSYGSERPGNSDWGASSNNRFDDRSGATGSRERHGSEGRSGGSGGGYGEPGSGGGGAQGTAQTWEGSGFGGPDDNGRRFDRIDPGHVGAQGAHPMSSPVGGAYAGGGGISASGGYSSSARAYAAERQGGGGQGGRQGAMGGAMGASSSGYGRQHDPHYSEWRNRQIESLDRDYDEYRREHQSKFESDFGNWRTKRGEQRQSMGRVTEQMEVVGSDGQHIGKVDKVAGDRIILAKNDENSGGIHHSIPCSWIERVEDKVTVNKSREEAMHAWRDEEHNRALFEREDQGSTGPHVLNRSFSGTY